MGGIGGAQWICSGMVKYGTPGDHSSIQHRLLIGVGMFKNLKGEDFVGFKMNHDDGKDFENRCST